VGTCKETLGAHLNRSRLLRAPPSRGRGVSQVSLPNAIFGLQMAVGLSKWAKNPFSRSRTVAPPKSLLLMKSDDLRAGLF